MAFEDHFSYQAELYRRHRPTYPTALFAFLASVVPQLELAWDCGTGNGQVAHVLAHEFARVIATDASERQIALARPHPRVIYRVAPAEESGIDAASVDLVTAGQAVHWFDFERFYGEVERVLRPEGLLAVFCYSLPVITAGVDAQVNKLFTELLADYWPPERAHVDAYYQTIPFPFRELEIPTFTGETEWNYGDLVGYLGSWSATVRYRRQQGLDPIAEIREDLARSWGDPAETKPVHWPIHLRVGQV